MKDITVIIRSVGERTEQLCKKIILEQGVQEEDLIIVREVPFSASMKKSFEIGLERGNKWTYCIDADVLLRKHSIKKMIQFADNQKKNVCEIQGLVLDKFFSGPREAGNHLYRTSLLEKVIERIPSEGENIRPETHALNSMAADGYPWKNIAYLVGIHDEEQYNFDIYRKSFVQAVKHLNYAELIVHHWKKNLDNDSDFRVALTAFSEGIRNTDTVYINSEQDLYRELFNQSGFQEKKELDISTISLNDIDKRINNWVIDEEYYNYFPNSLGLRSSSEVISQKLKSSIKKRGLLNTLRLSTSQFFLALGKKIGSKVTD